MHEELFKVYLTLCEDIDENAEVIDTRHYLGIVEVDFLWNGEWSIIEVTEEQWEILKKTQ